MQNKYVGDIGDFGKYSLLNTLCPRLGGNEGPQYSLGIVWYLVPNDCRLGQGSLTRYPSLEVLDPDLFNQLQEIVAEKNGKKRNVHEIRKTGILPAARAFYEERLTFDEMPSIGAAARERRILYRREWIGGAVAETDGCDIIFVDPDNGLEVASTRSHHKRGPKYVFFEELKCLTARPASPSLVIYQHMNLTERVEQQIQRRLVEIAGMLDGYASPFALQFRTSRFFFVVPTRRHQSALVERAQRLTKKPWDEHFKLVRLQK